MPGIKLNYADRFTRTRRAPSPRQIACVWVTFIAIVIAALFMSVCTEIENNHFDSFFPRRPESPSSHYYMSFEKDLVHDEDTWRRWLEMLDTEGKRDDWFDRPLTESERRRMEVRIAENPRWNRFVLLVMHGVPIQLVFMGIAVGEGVLLMWWLDKRQNPRKWRTAAAGTALMISLLILTLGVREYIGFFFGDKVF